ncbi:MAG TPA: hypothetical protein VKT49_07235 [Bryobacteraceae bacterium]|nr:hypothetical protein [Bryobacteraceae bacterium]
MWNALSFASTKEILLVLAGVLVIAGAIFGYRAWRNSRITPEERERRRRGELVARGKMGDATITEIRGELLFYSYDVRGVEYIASQDMSVLKDYLPADLSVLIGAVSVRYDPKNPANSIVLAEDWSGLRPHGQLEEVKSQRSKVKSQK